MVRQITATFAALLLSAAMMSACSTVTDGAAEDIRINIAGTGEALCDVTQPGRRYRVYAPSTMRVMRSRDDLRIRCKAPGNREQVVILKSVVSDKFSYNAFNLGLGAAWDGMTGAMYAYPDTVLMDFSNMVATSYPQPDYQDVFDKYPDLMQMEQFRPGQPALGSDRGTTVPTMQLRQGEEDNSMGIMMPVTRPGSGDSIPTAGTTPQGPVSLVSPKSSVAAPGTTSSSAATGITPSGNARTYSNGAETTALKPGSGDTTSNTATSTSTNANSISSRITTKPSTPTTHIFTNKVGQLPSTNQ